VDPVSDPILLGKSGSAANRTRASGSVALPQDHRGGNFFLIIFKNSLRTSLETHYSATHIISLTPQLYSRG
jgi:hypothetical protein